MSPKALLSAALEKVESASIRAWATSAHNYPILLKEAAARIERGRTDPLQLTTAIVCCAIGL